MKALKKLSPIAMLADKGSDGLKMLSPIAYLLSGNDKKDKENNAPSQAKQAEENVSGSKYSKSTQMQGWGKARRRCGGKVGHKKK